MTFYYNGKEYDQEVEMKSAGGGLLETYRTPHPITGRMTRLYACFVDPNEPSKKLDIVCQTQSNCTSCLATRSGHNTPGCVYGKYAGYPIEYFILDK